MPPGRKTKLTKKTFEKIIKELEKGKTIKATCGNVGITESTYYNWIKQGEESTKNDLYCKLANQASIAIKKGQSKYQDVIYENAIEKRNWTCAAWYLERTDPKNFAKRDYHSVDMEAEVKSEVTVNLLERMKQKREELNDLGSD